MPWFFFMILSARRIFVHILYLIEVFSASFNLIESLSLCILLRSSLPPLYLIEALSPFIDILRHLPYRNGPFAERSDINRHRFVLPNNFLFVTWLEILSIYCLIEKFCQLIELFEFTEFLIFGLFCKINWNLNIFLKRWVSANIT